MKNTLVTLPEFATAGQLIQYQKKETLLREGDLCGKIFIIEKGVIRSWFNDDGNDITFQFFSQGDIVTSFESIKSQCPSLYNIETITPVTLRVISQKELGQILCQNNALNEAVNNYIAQRLYHYQKLFIFHIKNKPQQRFDELLRQQPEIFAQVPHHYIASYLGITPVSLSRIRHKKNDEH